MAEYRVKWEIDIEADSPVFAALQALDIQKDFDSTALIFVVTDEEGNITEIDFEDEDNG